MVVYCMRGTFVLNIDNLNDIESRRRVLFHAALDAGGVNCRVVVMEESRSPAALLWVKVQSVT